MKISANAKEFVKEEIKKGFADDLKKAVAAKEAVKKTAEKKYMSFKADLDDAKAEFAKKVYALVRKHGLTLMESNSEIEGIVVYVKGHYGDIDDDVFEQTADTGSDLVAASKAVRVVEDKISDACKKALYEIEIHGRKDTIGKIVQEAILEIREGK